MNRSSTDSVWVCGGSLPCPDPKLGGSAFHMRTGKSLAVSRYPVAVCLVPDMSGRHFECESVGYRLCPGTRQRPAWYQSWWGWHFICEPVGHRLCPGTRQRPAWSRSSLGRYFICGPFRFGPVQGPELAWLSRIRCVRLCVDISRDY